MDQVTAVRIGQKRDGSDMWRLPIDPTVSVRGQNEVVSRVIAKNVTYGSVKERWARGDTEVTVTGVLINHERDANGQPIEVSVDVARLTALLTAEKPLLISSLLTDQVAVRMLVVTGWEFPETPGIQNQAYSFTGLSDVDFELVTTL